MRSDENVVEEFRSRSPPVVARLVVEMHAMRTALKLAIPLTALAAVAWSGTFVAWNFRISRAIRNNERGVLRAAGCRALPSLIASLMPDRRLTFLADVHRLIVDKVAGSGGASRDLEFLKEHEIEATDTIDVRTRKCREIQEWWRKNHDFYHQEWRVWSSRCRS